MINKQLYLSAVIGLLMIGGLFSPARVSAVNPHPAHEGLQPVLESHQPVDEDESLQQTRYWNLIAGRLARQIMTNGRLDSNTLYVDENPVATEISQYLENQLSESLMKSGARVSAPARARYAIELDIDVRERSDGHGTEYAEGGDIDQSWAIRERATAYPGQNAYYEMAPLMKNQPVNLNSLAGTDSEIIITTRIMERGWILKSYTYAFYFSDEDLNFENGLEHEKELEPAESIEFQYHQGAFLDYQQKLDGEIEQLINSYGF